jgi:hypothetical protein
LDQQLAKELSQYDILHIFVDYLNGFTLLDNELKEFEENPTLIFVSRLLCSTFLPRAALDRVRNALTRSQKPPTIITILPIMFTTCEFKPF